MTTLLIFVALIGLILLGVPIAVAMGLTAVATFVLMGEARILTMVAQRMYASTTAFTLLAIPFFILAGNLMNTGGITRRVFRFAQALVGHIWGGLGQVNVVASMIFSGMSGSAVADAAGLGLIEMKAMTASGYNRNFSAAITAASSTIGPVVPPSIPFVIYGSLTGVSVGKLFLAGFIPGALMGLALMVAISIISRRRDYPREARASARELLASAREAALPLGTPVIIIGGILGGIFTPTEAAVVASVYALFLGLFVYREIKVGDLPRVFWETIVYSTRVMFIISAAGFFGWLLIRQKIPQQVITGLTAFTDSRLALLAMIVFILLVLGCFIEGIAVFVITIPVFMPLIARYGIDEVQFGVIMTLASMLGLLTPPRWDEPLFGLEHQPGPDRRPLPGAAPLSSGDFHRPAGGDVYPRHLAGAAQSADGGTANESDADPVEGQPCPGGPGCRRRDARAVHLLLRPAADPAFRQRPVPLRPHPFHGLVRRDRGDIVRLARIYRFRGALAGKRPLPRGLDLRQASTPRRGRRRLPGDRYAVSPFSPRHDLPGVASDLDGQ